MGIVRVLDIPVLKVSAAVVSVYISVVIATLQRESRDNKIREQILGFAILFLISLFVYVVI